MQPIVKKTLVVTPRNPGRLVVGRLPVDFYYFSSTITVFKILTRWPLKFSSIALVNVSSAKRFDISVLPAGM
jgi:hypothetical protein